MKVRGNQKERQVKFDYYTPLFPWIKGIASRKRIGRIQLSVFLVEMSSHPLR